MKFWSLQPSLEDSKPLQTRRLPGLSVTPHGTLNTSFTEFMKELEIGLSACDTPGPGGHMHIKHIVVEISNRSFTEQQRATYSLRGDNTLVAGSSAAGPYLLRQFWISTWSVFIIIGSANHFAGLEILQQASAPFACPYNQLKNLETDSSHPKLNWLRESFSRFWCMSKFGNH